MPSWLKIGSMVVMAEVVVHGLAAGVLNDWEEFVQTVIFLLVFGLVIGGLVFGLLVRFGLAVSRNPRRNRPAITGLICGLLGLASYSIFFVGAPPIVGAGAVVLGKAGLGQAKTERGGAGLAWFAIGLGLLAVGSWLFLYIAALILGDFPFGLF